MADFLTRLAERTLGVASMVQPIIAPVFAPEPALASEAQYRQHADMSLDLARDEVVPAQDRFSPADVKSSLLPTGVPARDAPPMTREQTESPGSRGIPARYPMAGTHRSDPATQGTRDRYPSHDTGQGAATPTPGVGLVQGTLDSLSPAQYLEASAPEKSAPAPTIRVTIGRIEVRAVMPAQEPAARPPSTRPRPRLSLDDYLKQQNGGQR